MLLQQRYITLCKEGYEKKLKINVGFSRIILEYYDFLG